MVMPASDSLIVERPSDDIAVLKINRPQVRNALNLEVRTRLADEIMRCGADQAVRCIIVTGSDVAFAAGADIGEMAEAGPVEVMSRNVQKYWRTIMDCPKPLIAAVEGFALGGGLELALCADIIVAGEGAKARTACRPPSRDVADHDRENVWRRRGVEHGRRQRSCAERAGTPTRA
jgi:enoyl-CoA hydratase/carnithine racemase